MNDDTPMNSPDLDPLHELASAHLDGATSADERAQVRGSAQLTSIVASFADLRERLADVPPVAASVRAASITAALAVFDDLHGTLDDTTDDDTTDDELPDDELPAAAPAAVVHLSTRRRWPAIVMSAAAGFALLGIAGVAVFGGSSEDQSTADTAAVAREMSATGEGATETMAAGDQPASTIGEILAPGSVALVIESPEQLLELIDPKVMADVDTSGGTDSTTLESTGAPEASPSRPAVDCLSPTQVFLADILFENELAIAARDTVTGVTVAITDDCRVLVAVGP